MEKAVAENRAETIEAKKLKLEVEKLKLAQKDIYTNAIMRRREELLKEGERNVSIEERREILERVKSGEITAEEVKRIQSPAKSKDVERGFPTFIEKSLPKGDKD